jgi:hypothetical protein
MASGTIPRSAVGFIDTAHLLATISGNDKTYTATQPCWAAVSLGGASGEYGYAYVNNVRILTHDSGSVPNIGYVTGNPIEVTIPLDRGQVLKIQGASAVARIFAMK